MDDRPRDIIPMQRSGDSERRSPCDNIVDMPPKRCHESGTGARAPGIVVALIVAIAGGAALGGGYGAFIGLCGKKFVNVGLALTIPFWVNVPAQMGFWWGHVQDRKWRSTVSLIGFATCGYAVCVGWLASVLDGPGLVFNPVRQIGFLCDVTVHGIWVHSMETELKAMSPCLLTLRFGEVLWIFLGGLMSGGAPTPYPYCRECKRWMEDEATVRVRYEPESTAEARTFALDLIEGRYDSLLSLNTLLAETEKGLELSAFTCDGCDTRHVLNATWHRATPDPEASEVEQMLESGTGRRLVMGLLVPDEVRQHIVQLVRIQSANANAA